MAKPFTALLGDIAEDLAVHLGPKALSNFSPDDVLVNYSGRHYPSPQRWPLVRVGIFGSAYDKPSKVMDTHRLEGLTSSGPSMDLVGLSRQIGHEAGKQNQVLVTGACGGLPYEAIIAAKEVNPSAFVIGISPAPDEKTHLERSFPLDFHDWIIYAGSRDKVGNLLVNKGLLPEYQGVNFADRDNRNVELIHSAIAIMGGSGTLDELAGAWEMGRVVLLAKGSGGIADTISPVFDSIMQYKNTGASYFVESDPRVIVQRAIAEARINMIRAGDYDLKTPFGSVWVYRQGSEGVLVHFRDYEQTLKGVRPLEDGNLSPECVLITSKMDNLKQTFASFPQLKASNYNDELAYTGPVHSLDDVRKTIHRFNRMTKDHSISYIRFVDHRTRQAA